MADPLQIVPDAPPQAAIAPAQVSPDPAPAAAPPDLETIFKTIGQKYGLDPELLKAVAQQESSGNLGAIGPPTSTGGHAYGLMQILDSNLKTYGVTNWRDPWQNIDAGARILKEQMAAKGNVHDALAGYSGGAKDYASNVLSKLQIIPDAEGASPGPAIVPDAPPAQAGGVTPDQAPDQPAPSGAEPGFFSALGRSLTQSGKGIGQTVGLVAGAPKPAAAVNDALAQEQAKPFSQGMLDPSWYTTQAGTMLGQAPAPVAGAIAGGVAGTSVGGPVGGIIGAVLGGGGMQMLQSFGPAVSQNMAQGMSYNDAFDKAFKEAGIESAVVGAMSAVPGGNLLKNWALTGVKKAAAEFLVNAGIVQPAIGGVGQVVTDVAEGKPITLDDLATGYVQNALLGTGLHAGHVVAGKVLPRGTETETPPPTPKPAEPALGKTTDEILGQMGVSRTPPPEQGLPGVTTALPRTTGEDRSGPASVAPIPSPDIITQSGPKVPGEQEVKTGPDIVNAKPEIIDAAPPRSNAQPLEPAMRDDTGAIHVGAPGAIRLGTPREIYADIATRAAVEPERLEPGFVGTDGRFMTHEEASAAVRAQPLEAEAPPTLRGPEFNPETGEIDPRGWTTEQTARLPEIQPDTIDVWHGSPHEFDEFGSGKVGTGEGAASFGHGEAYVAEHPDVAKTYQQDLAKSTVGGEPFNIESPLHQAAQLTDEFGSREGAAQEVNARLARDPGDTFNRNVLYHLQADKELPPLETAGNLYKAQILGHPDEFLDLDKPLNQQSPQVQAALERAQLPGWVHTNLNITGGDYIYGLKAAGVDPAEVSQRLSVAGIKGNRYLDQKSREVAATDIARKQNDIDVQRAVIAEQEKNPNQPPRYIQNLKEQLAAKEQALEDAKSFKPTRNYVVYKAEHVRALERNGTPIQRVLESKAPGEPMPQHVIDEVAQGAHETNDAIGELLTEAAGGGTGRRTPPPGGGGPDSPEGRRRKMMGEASKISAAINAMPNDPLSFNRMAKITRWLGTMPGVAADDRTVAEYLHHVTARDADKHALGIDGADAAKAYGQLPAKRQEPVNKVIEYHDATGQELPEPHKDGSMTLTMDPRPFGKLPWTLQLSEPGEKVHLDPEQVAALKGARDFLDRRQVEVPEAKARQLGYDGPFSKVVDGKLQIDIDAIRHAAETATDKGLKKSAERALGIATAAIGSKRVSYWPRQRYGDWVISVTPKVPMTGTGHALPGERWVSKVDSMSPWDSFKGIFTSTKGNTPTRKVLAEVARLEKRFSPKDYDIKYDKPPPRLRDELNVPMIERALESVDLSHEDWKTLTEAGLRGEDLAAIKDAIIEKLYQDMLAGFRQQRENVPGASTDLPRALGDYIRQSSNVIAQARHGRAVDEAYLNTQLHRDPTTRSYVAAHKRYNEGAESRAWSAARMVAFTKYLWGSPMSAVLQLTQTPMVTGSQLTGVIGPRGMVMVGNALQQALRAMRVDGRGVKTSIEALRGMVTPQEYAGLMQAYREGRLNPVLPQDLAGGTMSAQMRRSLPIPSRIYDIGGSMFNAADTTNRVASWLAYHRAAQLPGAKAKFAKAYKNDALFQREVGNEVDPVKLANWAVNETQFMSGRMGGAPITHGAGGLAFQFQHYNWNYMRLLHKNFTKMGPQGKVAGTMMLGALVGAGGLLGLPFAKDAEQAADAAVKFVTGIDPRYDAKLRELIADTGLAKMADEYMGWTPGRAAEMAMEGPSRLATGLDLGNRMALGNLLPGSTDLMSGVPFLEATVGAAIEATKRFNSQQPLGAMAALLPAGLANPMKALAVYPEEGVKSASGASAQFMPSQITPGMRIARGLGATPAAIARRQQAMADKNAITYGTDEATKNLRNAIVGQYALYEDAIKSGNTTAAAAYGAKAQQLIADNIDRLRDPSIPPEQQIPLPSPGQIRSGIMRFINPLAIRNSRALRPKQAALASSPYPDQ